MLSGIKKYFSMQLIIKFIIILFCVTVIFFTASMAPPEKFDEPVIVEIEEGSNLGQIGDTLYKNKIIRSPFWFRFFVIFFEGEHSVPAGQYYFSEPEMVFNVAKRISKGDYGLQPLRITIIEGWNLFRIADYLDENFEKFDKEKFFSIAKEGYLAPDTYFFSPLSSTEQIINKMEKNFEARMLSIIEETNFERTTEEIIIMASILEAEANTVESKRNVAGILWKRLEAEMPLQVDATFVYINNKNTYELTLEDLQIDSPYNTYKYTGLPPTPINNPGVNAIRAAINPIENSYWYFLSDLAGNMYYASDFEEHQFNRENYLRR